MHLGEIVYQRGDHEAAFARLDRSVELVGNVPPSPTTARVLGNVARYRAIAGDPRAVDLGRAALAIAEQLGLDDMRAQAQITIGTVRTMAGDDAGIADIEAGIAIAEAAGSPEAARGYGNLKWIFLVRGDPRTREVTERSLQLAERFGNAQGVIQSKGNLADLMYLQGRWDDALAIADELLADAEAGNSNRMDPWLWLLRAGIRLARDDVVGASEDAAAALERARTAKDKQLAQFTAVSSAAVAVAMGDLSLARRRVDEVGLDRIAEGPANRTDLLRPVEEIGAVEEYLRFAQRRGHEDRPWIEAAAHFLQGDYLRAAHIYSSMGSRTDEAYARLRAAGALLADGRRAEADTELQQALGFYRSVGATRYIREGEALLAQTA